MKEQIGHVYVDSGLMFCGDPCYFWASDPSTLKKKVGSWQDLCDHLDKRPHPSRLELGGLGCVVSSGYGDGVYPVFIETNAEGRIASITVQFIGDEDEEDGEEEEEENDEPSV